MRIQISLALVFATLACSPWAHADKRNFDLAGKIYTKWLYQNDDSQGLLTHGNPFWPDNIGGHNGVGSEFELLVMGRVSPKVRAQARLKSRFGGLWQDWWENGDLKETGADTSGESLGMNRAEYLKLRGYWIDAALPIPTVRNVRVGSSDLGMFDPWTIGKMRYIDRDNAKGTFVTGASGEREVEYTLAAIALPKLFVGPGWSTGIGDPEVRNPLYSRDWAYAGKLRWNGADLGTLTAIAAVTRDHEIDLADPDAEGSLQGQCLDQLGAPIEGCVHDHAVETVPRYSSTVGTLAYRGFFAEEVVSVNLTAAMSSSDINEAVAANGVAGNEGVSPVVFDDVTDVAGVARVELFDPWDIGLSLQLEGFSIGEHFNAIFGARREADVLLTDGFVGGGQLPTLNLANEFMDFDEAFYESCIGWYGATMKPRWEGDAWTWTGEVTWIGYHTDAQERDVESTYPDFLHTDGFTDTELYDYANTFDRGRDPRSVFRRNQARTTWLGALGATWAPDLEVPWQFDVRARYIHDLDGRSDTTVLDDYVGDALFASIAAEVEAAQGLKIRGGVELQRWDEGNRRGTLELGYGDDTTDKLKGFLGGSYLYEGWSLIYRLEYLYKDQRREREPDQLWHVVRSKAALEVKW
jgi:hypothetical protein